MWRKILVVAGVVLAVGAVVSAVLIWRFLTLLKQHANFVNTRIPRQALETHLKQSGQYPADLASLEARADSRQLIDQYGNQYHYESTGDTYVLVSYGSDGQPDGVDYWGLRETQLLEKHSDFETGPWSTCGQPKRDLVLSDLGAHQACGIK